MGLCPEKIVKIRTELTLILCGSVLFTALLITFVSAHFFTRDQESYLNDLHSTIALFRKTQIALQMDDLYSRSASWVGSIQALENAVKTEGAVSGEIWEDNVLVAAYPHSSGLVSPPVMKPSGWSLSFEEKTKKTVQWIGYHGKRAVRLTLPDSFLTESLSPFQGTRLLMIDSEEQIFALNGGGHSSPDYLPIKSALKDLLSTPLGVVKTKRYLGRDGAYFLGATAPFSTATPLIVLVSTPRSAVDAVVFRTYRQSALIAILCILFFVILAVAFAGRITRPLNALARQASEVAKGNFGAQITSGTNRHNEIGIMARSFNHMSRDLHTFRNDLRKTERLVALGQFSAAIAHEVKNPLAAILVNAQLAVLLLKNRGEEIPPEIATALSAVQTETRRANTIVTGLMHFARQEPPPSQSIDLAQRLKESAALVAPLAQQQGIFLNFETLDHPVSCVANGDQIHQVILNFVQNALYAVKDAVEKKVTLRLVAQGNEACIEVVDTGQGMTSEVLDHLFEPFFTTKKTGEGTGLGLSICHGIIRNHGGRIEVKSRPGQGASFRICLPLVTPIPVKRAA